MARKPESLFAVKVDGALKALGGTWFNIQQMSINGTPDRLGCLNGTFVALELKTLKGKASKLQQYYIQEVSKSGGYAAIVSPANWETVLRDLVIISQGGEHAPTNRTQR